VSTFVLVHGAWHGAWCWERLVPELEARGHATIAMDMPIGDPRATFDDYATAVIDASAGAEDVVLVGHSLGGMVVPIVATRHQVKAVVWLCPVVPNFGGLPWDGLPEMAAPGTFDGLVSNDEGASTWPSLESATNAFYHDCDPADAAAAFARLRPMNPKSLWDRAYPLSEWPDSKRVAIITTDDRAVTREWALAACRGRLKVEPIELPGSHSPFLSRPAELAETLVAAT